MSTKNPGVQTTQDPKVPRQPAGDPSKEYLTNKPIEQPLKPTSPPKTPPPRT